MQTAYAPSSTASAFRSLHSSRASNPRRFFHARGEVAKAWPCERGSPLVPSRPSSEGEPMRERLSHPRIAAILAFVLAVFMAATSRGQVQTPTSVTRGSLSGAVTANQGAVVGFRVTAHNLTYKLWYTVFTREGALHGAAGAAGSVRRERARARLLHRPRCGSISRRVKRRRPTSRSRRSAAAAARRRARPPKE